MSVHFSARSSQKVLESLRGRSERPLLVALDGHSASGKSTLAKRVKEGLEEVTLIHTDDFYRVMPERARATLTPPEGYAKFYDWQRLREQVLEPLRKNRVARYQHYDWTANLLGDTVEVEPKGIIVIEGCYSSRPELRPYYHLTIHVETPQPLRMARQKERHDYDAIWVARWEAAEAFYFSNYPPTSAITIRGDAL